MAATVTANLTDITNGEAADDANWTGEDGNSTEVFRQGAASQAWIVAKNGNETASFDAYSNNSNTAYDLSGTGTHLYVTLKCDIAPYIDYVHIGLQSDTAHGSSTSGTTYWTVVDNTTNVEWYGEWYTFVLDVNSSTTFSTTGTLDLAAITDVHINIDNSNSGNIRSIENSYIDGIRFGTGLTITGTTWDWADVAAIDANTSNKYDIIQQVGPGVFRVQGQLKVGNGATTTTPSSSNETLYFVDPATAGAAGGALGKLASGFYDFTVQGSGCTADFNNLSLLASTSTPFTVDASDTNLPASSVDWNGGTIIGSGTFDCKANQSYKAMSFVGCGQIDPSTSTFENNTISNYTGSEGGALLWPGGTTVKNCTFDNNQKSIEITQTANQTYDNLQFLNEDNTTKQSTHLNNGGTSIDISKNNGSNPLYYTATGGGTVSFIGSSVTVKVKCITESGTNIQSARVFLATSAAGSLPYDVTVTISNSGTTATVTHTAHGLSTGDKVVIYGADRNDNLGTKTITVTTANAYTFTTTGSHSGADTGTTIKSSFVYLEGLTDVNGEISMSRVLPADQNASGRARKSSGSPYYKNSPLTSSISSSGNTTLTAVMIED